MQAFNIENLKIVESKINLVYNACDLWALAGWYLQVFQDITVAASLCNIRRKIVESGFGLDRDALRATRYRKEQPRCFSVIRLWVVDQFKRKRSTWSRPLSSSLIFSLFFSTSFILLFPGRESGLVWFYPNRLSKFLSEIAQLKRYLRWSINRLDWFFPPLEKILDRDSLSM